MSNNRDELLRLLRETPNSLVIPKLVSEVEDNYPADLSCDSDLLYGVWCMVIFGGVALPSHCSDRHPGCKICR